MRQWPPELKVKLYALYDQLLPASEIARLLGKTIGQVNSMIYHEVAAGRMKRTGRRRRWALRNKNFNTMFVPPVMMEPVAIVVEDGLQIKKYPPGYAVGHWPQKNVNCGRAA